MDENALAGLVVDTALQIHRSLGPGLFESAYEAVLAYELTKRGLQVARQVPISLNWDGQAFDESYRADLIVNGKLLVELKSLEKLNPVHKKQVITYLKVGDIKLGLLINFGERLLKDGIERIVNGLPETD